MSYSVAIISSFVGKTPEDIAHSFVFDEAFRLAQRGIDVHIIRYKVENDSSSYGIKYHGLEKKIDLRALKFFMRNLSVYPPISLLRKPTLIYRENLYALNASRIVERNVNLIHAHFAYPEGLVGLLTKRRTGKPLIVTLHGYDILIEPSVRYGVRLSKRIDVIINRVLNVADAVLTASKATFNEASKIVNDSSKIHLIPNAIDVQRFNPSLDGSKIRKRLRISRNTVVFTLRSHEPKYGLEYLIRAAPVVAKEKEDVVFVIGGDGSLRHYHEQLSAELGLKEKMIFTGRIPQSEVPYYYAMSDIVVVPSLQEAFGLVVSEAMACGKPVIGTWVGGIPDQIIDGYNGFLVQPRNSSQIAEKILWLINNPDESKLMGMNGRKVAEEKFNIVKRVDKIISLYEELLSTKHS
jgi:glycosyltransferase involved in cell wall biosynthesis